MERFANTAYSDLASSMDASQTSLDVVSGTSFPSSGNFRVLVDSEIMLCTARSGFTLTVVRGQEGTTATVHSSGVRVSTIITANTLNNYRSDLNIYDTYANRPAAGVAGRLFYASDNSYLQYDNGSEWITFGPCFKFKPFTNYASFSWVNQGSTTETMVNGLYTMSAPPVSGVNLRMKVKTAPSVPYTVTAYVSVSHFNSPSITYDTGLLWRESGTGEVVTFALSFDGPTLKVSKYNSATSFSANYVETSNYMTYPFSRPGFWIQIADDNTNRICRYSADGFNFIEIHSVGRTDFLTADQIGLFTYHANTILTSRTNYSHWWSWDEQ